MPDNLSNLITATQQMLASLAATANATTVSGRGANAAFVTAGQTKLTRVQELNNEQERLKADLKQKTAELAKAQKNLKAWYSEASTIVKLAYKSQQEKWVEFGLTAKR